MSGSPRGIARGDASAGKKPGDDGFGGPVAAIGPTPAQGIGPGECSRKTRIVASCHFARPVGEFWAKEQMRILHDDYWSDVSNARDGPASVPSP